MVDLLELIFFTLKIFSSQTNYNYFNYSFQEKILIKYGNAQKL